jgi:NADPH:quinone reductase-like Zn-dependent oxidoreductase
VGVVQDGPADLVGRSVFCLHPHQDVFQVPADRLGLIPNGVPVRRATLAANMETALNAVWDSGAGPGDSIVVVGAGVVGLLVAYLAARLPGAAVTVVDLNERGGRWRKPSGGVRRPGRRRADVVFHAGASAAS